MVDKKMPHHNAGVIDFKSLRYLLNRRLTQTSIGSDPGLYIVRSGNLHRVKSELFSIREHLAYSNKSIQNDICDSYLKIEVEI